MQKSINENALFHGRVRATLRDSLTDDIVYQSKWTDNLITNEAYNATLRRWGNKATISNESIITYGAVGNGSTSPTENDTAMENELGRNTLGTTTVSGTTLTIEVFFAEGVANGNITQFALFGEDATASADTGTMFEHATFDTPFTKTSSETLTIEINISKA